MLKLLLNRKLIVLLFGTLGILLTGNQCTSPTASKEDGGMDTISQNFSWEIDTLGGLFSSVRCIEIVNDTLIYAGGEFTPYGYGTTHNDYDRFNLAIWNGKKWTLEKVGFIEYNNIGPSPLTIIAIKVFPNGNIFALSSGSSTATWSNYHKKWITKYIGGGGTGAKDHMYARSENDIYFVGQNGSASHYNGTTITKLPTGVTTDLTDIWGNDKFIYAVGDPLFGGAPERVVLEHDGVSWKVINRHPYLGEEERAPDNQHQNIGMAQSVYVTPTNSLYIIGGFYHGQVRKIESKSPFRAKVMVDFLNYYIWHDDPFFTKQIRGNSENDIYASSSSGAKFYHFNGVRWKLFEIPTEFDFSSNTLTVKGNIWVNSLRTSFGFTRVIRGKRF